MDGLVERTETEEPALSFDAYEIAFHFAVEWGEDEVPAPLARTRDASEPSEPMESYERDLLLYAHRDQPPFQTLVAPVPPGLSVLTIRFPRSVVYESERRRVELGYSGGATGRTRWFEVQASGTFFARSRVVVLNLVLAPLERGAEESQLDEFDVIKLAKLWEGGEGRSVQEWEDTFRFEPAHGKAATLETIVGDVFRDWLHPVQPARPLAYRVGTVELQVPEREWRDQLFGDIAQLNEGGDPPDEGSERWERAVAVGGVLQGLLDFRAIDAAELGDVFARVNVDPRDESLVGFHKGTLLSLESEEEPDPERESPIGVDPYLALPNVVLLHNEQRLKAARACELYLSTGQPRPAAVRGEKDERVSIDETADGLDIITGRLAQHLPNIFHYESERELYDTGGHSRGFDDLEELIGLRRDELRSTLQRRERRRDRWTAGVALVSAVVVSVVAAVNDWFAETAVETIDWWLLLALAGLLWLAFRRARNRFF